MLRDVRVLEERHTPNPKQPTEPTGRDTQTQRQAGRPRPERIKDRQKNVPPLTPHGMRPIYINNEVHNISVWLNDMIKISTNLD